MGNIITLRGVVNYTFAFAFCHATVSSGEGTDAAWVRRITAQLSKRAPYFSLFRANCNFLIHRYQRAKMATHAQKWSLVWQTERLSELTSPVHRIGVTQIFSLQVKSTSGKPQQFQEILERVMIIVCIPIEYPRRKMRKAWTIPNSRLCCFVSAPSAFSDLMQTMARLFSYFIPCLISRPSFSA